MRLLFLLLILLPVTGLSQNLTVNEYDRFNKQTRIQLQPVRILSSGKANILLTYNASGSNLYVQLSGFGWGAFAIDEGQELIFLFSNDSAVRVKSTDVQTSTVNASFQNTYTHNYFIQAPDIKLMSEYDIVGIRKYGLGEHVEMKVSKDNALKIKKLSAQFLKELKMANIIRNLHDINLSDISKHIGDSVRFCARVYNTRYFESAVNKPTILDVNDSFTSQLNIIIWEQDRKNFSNAPESLYYKKKICVSGVVESNNNIPQIIIRNRHQITLNTPIDLSEVAKFVGDSVTVSGKVVTTKINTNISSSPIQLNLGAPYPDQLLTLVIEEKDREKFNDSPEVYYLHKKITVSGRIESYQGKPQILVQSKDQITEQPGDIGKIINQPDQLQAVTKIETAPVKSTPSQPQSIVEKPAIFPGGQEAWLTFLKNNLVCPRNELGIGEKKVVVANFLINTDGSASNIRIVQPGGKDFDQEVIRVIKLMPKWEPRMANGISVPVSVTQRVTFVR